ncbi:MAG: transcriptional regulator [Sulfitobacter sp.]
MHLAAHRKAVEMTQAASAGAVGVTRKPMSTVENQVFAPSIILALKLARVLLVKVENLFVLKGSCP